MPRVTTLLGSGAAALLAVSAVAVLVWPRQPDPAPAPQAGPETVTSVKFLVDDVGIAAADCPRGVGWADDPVHGEVMTLRGAGEFCQTSGPMIRTAGSWSVAAWVRLAKAPDGYAMTFVAQDGAYASGFYLQYSWFHRKWVCNWMQADMMNPTRNAASVSDEPVTTQWTHLVGTYDASTRRLLVYVNGVPGHAATIGKPWQAGGPLTIGRGKWDGKSSDLAQGQVTDVRVWGRALKPEEVITLRDAATRAS
ncbi:LamG domain-containing protein [Catellatospora tritici]|uniref:LamG domain-containing protein n=1 Tax=Catellatospora tritici TaxID=2851566 RepID=UPI001C2D8C12|nr:LamG domain-containing protein [Catellatospora tritici]MBV1850732.1 LamG domain-containing protein [Catellatospora tritici]MBV1850985.1 LamG domain-containing protein [Catellatospora tritici]